MLAVKQARLTELRTGCVINFGSSNQRVIEGPTVEGGVIRFKTETPAKLVIPYEVPLHGNCVVSVVG